MERKLSEKRLSDNQVFDAQVFDDEPIIIKPRTSSVQPSPDTPLAESKSIFSSLENFTVGFKGFSFGSADEPSVATGEESINGGAPQETAVFSDRKASLDQNVEGAQQVRAVSPTPVEAASLPIPIPSKPIESKPRQSSPLQQNAAISPRPQNEIPSRPQYAEIPPRPQITEIPPFKAETINPPIKQSKPLPAPPEESKINQLMEMGYPRASASIALSMSKNSVPDALDYLLSTGTKPIDTKNGISRPASISTSFERPESPGSTHSSKLSSSPAQSNPLNRRTSETVEKVRSNIDALLSLTSDDKTQQRPQSMVSEDLSRRQSEDRPASLHSRQSLDSGNVPLQRPHQQSGRGYAYKPFDQPDQYRPSTNQQQQSSQQPAVRPYAYKPFDNPPQRSSSPASINSQESSDSGRKNSLSSESRPYPQQPGAQQGYRPMPQFYRPPAQFTRPQYRPVGPAPQYRPGLPVYQQQIPQGSLPVYRPPPGQQPVPQGSQPIYRPAPGQQPVYRPTPGQQPIYMPAPYGQQPPPRPGGQPVYVNGPPLPRGQVVYRGPPLTQEQIARLQQQYGGGQRPR